VRAGKSMLCRWAQEYTRRAQQTGNGQAYQQRNSNFYWGWRKT